MYRELVAAGVSPQAARYVEEQAEKERQEFGQAAYDELKKFTLRAAIFGRILTDQELAEAALQIDADLIADTAYGRS